MKIVSKSRRLAAARAQEASQRRRRAWLAGLGLLAITCLFYLPAVSDGFIWDDDFHVTHNPQLESLAGLGRIWLKPGATPQYYPLVHTVFWIGYRIWGPWAPGFHLINLALHAANAVWLWRLLRRLAVPGAYWIAALWALHPLNVESVAWITECKNVLSTFFYLAAANMYLRFWAIDQPGALPGRWRDYAWATLLFVCALLSKTVACTLPAAILLLHYWQRGRIERRALALMLPWFAVALPLGLLTVALERDNVGATGPQWAFSPLDRVLIAGRAICFYAGKLLWPTRLTFIYPRWTIDAGQAWQWAFPLVAAAAPLMLWLGRGRWGRGPLCALLFFYGTLAPALGFFNVYPMRYAFVADHFQYLAGAGWLALLVAVALSAARRLKLARAPRVGLAAAVCLVLGVATWNRATVYRDGTSIWWDTIAKNPAANMAYGNLAKYLVLDGKLDQTERVYRKVLELNPLDAEAHNNLGFALESRGEFKESIEQYRAALRISPNYPEAQCNLGFALIREGDRSEAERHLRRAIELKPKYADAHNNLGMLLAYEGNLEAALSEYHAALHADPAHAGAHFNLGTLLLGQRQSAGAQRELLEAIRLNPKLAEAHNNLGSLWLSQRRWAAARDEFSRAVALTPRDAAARQNLATVLEQLGDLPAAIEQWREAQRLNPADPRPRQNLQRLLGGKARP
ncbi:MAG TPA: tetratricopeptide repeat protein [Pirellulales bacterium]